MSKLWFTGLVLCVFAVACKKDTTDIELAALQLGKDTVIIRSYLVAHNLNAIAKKDNATGEFYIIDTLGTGNALYTSSTLITVGYTGSVLGSSTPFTQTNSF